MVEKTYLNTGGAAPYLADAEADALFSDALENVLADMAAAGSVGKPASVLLIPPDITRFHSRAGFLTDIACRELTRAGIALTVLPALGTHIPMTDAELQRMFPHTPQSLFRIHDWRNDVVELGRIEKEWIENATQGAVSYDWPVQVNKLLRDGGFDLIISLGQVVPHEVTGMANHAKNLLVGTGGKEAIDKSHFAGAAFGMERIMGRTNTPVRAMLDEGLARFGKKLPPILWSLTVITTSGADVTDGAGNCNESETTASTGTPQGAPALRGLYVGFGRECFEQAAALARQVNVTLLDEPIRKAVVYLEPEEFRTMWLGNKAVYRTRMAMADGGELLIIAPGLERFGEDKGIDALIRAHGYRPAHAILEKVNAATKSAGGRDRSRSRSPTAANADLANNLSAAAHLIHGSSEGRFTVRYCPGPHISRKEIESVGYEWGDIGEALSRYDIRTLPAGWNTHTDGERFFFVPNPALGLWVRTASEIASR